MSNIYFNNVLIPSFVTITGISYQTLSDLEHNLVGLGKGVGLYDLGTKQRGKKISLTFNIKKDEGKLTILDKLETLAEWLKGDDFKPSKLVLPDFANSYYMAKINNSVDIEDAITLGKGTIEFILTYPNRIETTFTNQQLITNPQTINYTGTAEVYPIIIFNVLQTCTSLQLNVSNGKYNNFIKLVGNFLPDDYITIDLKTRKVTINDVVTMSLLTLDSQFHKLVKGNNTYTNSSPTNTTVYVGYYKEYL